MYGEVLKFGAMIVDALVAATQPVFVYPRPRRNDSRRPETTPVSLPRTIHVAAAAPPRPASAEYDVNLAGTSRRTASCEAARGSSSVRRAARMLSGGGVSPLERLASVRARVASSSAPRWGGRRRERVATSAGPRRTSRRSDNQRGRHGDVRGRGRARRHFGAPGHLRDQVPSGRPEEGSRRRRAGTHASRRLRSVSFDVRRAGPARVPWTSRRKVFGEDAFEAVAVPRRRRCTG